jgi:hypothetical protein
VLVGVADPLRRLLALTARSQRRGDGRGHEQLIHEMALTMRGRCGMTEALQC